MISHNNLIINNKLKLLIVYENVNITLIRNHLEGSMQDKITINSSYPIATTISVLNDALQKELLYANSRYETFKQECNFFEKKYNMDSNHFIDSFESGILGDEIQWFDWYSVYRAKELWKKKYNIINEISWN